MRILIDIAHIARGGAERQTVQLAGGLARRGHEVLLVVNKTVDAYEREIAAGQVNVRPLGRVETYDPRTLSDLMSLCRRGRPEVVLAVMFNATFWARLAALPLGVPCVTAEHSSSRRVRRQSLVANTLLGRWTRATVACGRGQIPSLVRAGNPERNIVVIPNGVDTAEYYPDADAGAAFRAEAGIPHDAVLVGLVAAHRREKRHDRFIRLIAGLRAAGLDVWGCMVGGGPLLEANRTVAEESPAADRLVVAGPRSDMRAVYSGLDLVVLVSDNVETFPLSFLEAQACGRPVAGMETGAVAETFATGSGVLIRQGDEEQLLCEVAALVGDRDRLRTMGEHGRAWVHENLTIEHMVARYEKLLWDVVRR
jgi:glycosyltransferase involved in cell wall biosynthesis